MPLLALSFHRTLALALCATLINTSLPAQAPSAKPILPPAHRSRTAPLTPQ